MSAALGQDRVWQVKGVAQQTAAATPSAEGKGEAGGEGQPASAASSIEVSSPAALTYSIPGTWLVAFSSQIKQVMIAALAASLVEMPRLVQ